MVSCSLIYAEIWTNQKTTGRKSASSARWRVEAKKHFRSGDEITSTQTVAPPSLARSEGSFSCDILKNITILDPNLTKFPCTFVNKILTTRRSTDATQISYVKASQSFFFRLQNLSLPFRNQESKERVECSEKVPMRVCWLRVLSFEQWVERSQTLAGFFCIRAYLTGSQLQRIWCLKSKKTLVTFISSSIHDPVICVWQSKSG